MNHDVTLTESSRERPPVLIVGAHRSGTSATAVALQSLGLQIGQRLDSHAEPKALQSLHEDYLGTVDAAWWRPESFFRSIETAGGMPACVDYVRRKAAGEFLGTLGYSRNLKGLWLRHRIRAGAPWGWKEPRTTLFAPAWLQIFPAARILHVVRHPLDVALSIQHRELKFRAAGDRPNEGLDDLETCFDLAITYLRVGDALQSVARHYLRLRFEDLQQESASTLRLLADFARLTPTARQFSAAAEPIEPEKAGRWRSLPEETSRRLLAKHPIVAELGYAPDTCTR